MAIGDLLYEKVIDFSTNPSVPLSLFGSGITAAYDPTSQTLQASIGQYQGGVIFSGEPTCVDHDAECELTLKIVADPSARKHTGGWLVTASGTQPNGYRFNSLDNLFGISRWSSGVESSLAGSGATGGLLVNQSYLFKFSKVGQTLSLYVDGVMKWQASDASFTDLRPALFLYGCTVQLSRVVWRHRISFVDEPLASLFKPQPITAIPANPETRAQFQPQDLAWRGGEGKGFAGPVNQQPITQELLCQPGLDLFWTRDGVLAPAQGYIESTVTISGEGVRRRVLCFDQAGNLVGETMSRASDGKYRFDLLWLNRRYMLVAQDDPAFGPADYNAVAADYQQPTPYAPGQGVGLV